MSCSKCKTPDPRIAKAVQVLKLNADQSAGSYSAGPLHNRFEVVVSLQAGITNSTVHVYRTSGNLEADLPVKGLIGTVAFNARGGSLDGRCPPGARFTFELDDYAAPGTEFVSVSLVTWREA